MNHIRNQERQQRPGPPGPYPEAQSLDTELKPKPQGEVIVPTEKIK